jgi:putative oxidoreductase
MVTHQARLDFATLLLRLGLGILFILHGYYKISQEGMVWWNEQELPRILQAVIAYGELVCGIALVLGFLTRLAALGIVVIMVGAIVMVTGKKGLVPLNFGPGQERLNFLAIGPEYNIAIIVMCLALILLGGGSLSLDYCLSRWFRRKAPQVESGAKPPAAAPASGV